MKKKILTLSAVLLLLITLALSASAATIKEFKTKSTFVPVTYSSHKSTSSITLYGNADYLCMKAYSETNNNEYFYIDIYSDSKRTKKILEYGNTFKKGTIYEDIFFDLTSLKSKTYYATSYVMKESTRYPDKRKVKDPSTVKNFNIVVKRDGTSIKNMKCFMYGYENTYYGPAIYWYSVPGATKYYVYKYVDKEYKKIATVKANGEDFNYYIDKSLKDKNTTAHYKVKALNCTGSTALSLNKVKAVTLKTPTIKTELLTYGIKVTWSKPKSSCSYILLRSTNGGEWKTLSRTSNTYYYDTEVKSGNTYSYTVVAYNKELISGFHPSGAKRFYVAAPYLRSVTATEDGKLKVLWSSVQNAESYNVYRKAPGASGWSKVANVKTTEYVDSDCQKNNLYTYTVRAVIGKNQSLYSKKDKAGAIIDTPVLNEIERTQEGYAKITWNKIDGVSYKVYRKTAGGGWTLITTTSANEYTDKGYFINSSEYYYTVKSCIGSVNGGFDKAGKRFIYMKNLKNLKPYGLSEGIGLEWQKVENAESYNVYRKTDDTEYELIGSTQNAYFEDVTAQVDVSYKYKVAYVLGGEEKSNYSAEVPAYLSSEYVSFADELAIYSDYTSNWVLKLSESDDEALYRLYKRTDNGWVYMFSQKSLDGKVSFGDETPGVESEYAVSLVKKEGIVTRIPSSGKKLIAFDFAVKLKMDQENYAAVLNWDAVEGAEKYNIYDERYNYIATVDGSATSYTVTSLVPNDYYRFIVGTVKNGSEIKRRSNTDYLIKVRTASASMSNNGVTVSYDTSGMVSNYYVYRKTSVDGEWKCIATPSATGSYTDPNVKDGQTYYYCVRAKLDEDGDFSAFPKTSTKITFIKSTKIAEVKYCKDAFQITWEKSNVADYYEVLRKVGSGSWKTVYKTKDGKTVKYKDKDVKSGTKYQYAVKVIKDGFKSPAAKITRTFIAPPTKVTAKKVDSGIKISFSKVTGAQYYYVYRKGTDGKWKNIGKVKSSVTSYTDKTAKKGTTYSYCVRTYYNKYLSYKSTDVSCKR